MPCESISQCRLANIFGRSGVVVSGTGTRNTLKLRSIGIQDYSVFEGEKRIGRIRFADEHMPGVWWNVNVHLTGGLPMGSASDLDTAKAEFKAAWEALKARIPPEQLAATFSGLAPRDQIRRLPNDATGMLDIRWPG